MKVSFTMEQLTDGNYYISKDQIKKSGIGFFNGDVWTIKVLRE